MKRLLIIFLCCLCFSGCSIKNTSEGQVDTSCEITPNITSFSNNHYGFEYYYIVDNNTDVVYLMVFGAYRCALSVMLNPDGTPVTVDQLN